MRDVNRREEECLRSRRAINTVGDDVVGVNTKSSMLPRAIAVAIVVRGRVGGCQLARHDVEREIGNKKSTRDTRLAGRACLHTRRLVSPRSWALARVSPIPFRWLLQYVLASFFSIWKPRQ